jgi:hypothetical protein
VGHLRDHLEFNPASTYEEWIASVHPENALVGGVGGGGDDDRVAVDRVAVDRVLVDARFFVEHSDHMRLWNDAIQGASLFRRSGGREYAHGVRLAERRRKMVLTRNDLENVVLVTCVVAFQRFPD